MQGLNPSFSGCPALGTYSYKAAEKRVQGLNPSFSGCPALGNIKRMTKSQNSIVLIPLLVDVPLWDCYCVIRNINLLSLNPSFSGCPALGYS